jgi:predicted TIM-barrel fold metal-dependent hydrolase
MDLTRRQFATAAGAAVLATATGDFAMPAAFTPPPAGSVDCHAHIMLKSAPLAPGRHSEPARDVPVEEYIAVLDTHGVARGVLTQPSFYGTDNSLLLQALARYPDRLRGTGIVAPAAGEAELAALRRGGVRGLRLNWFHRDTLPDARGADYQRLFARARDLDLHVELYLEGAKMPDVLPAIRASGAKIVLDHFGSPEPAAGVAGAGFRAVLDAVSAGSTWVKLSAPYRLGGGPAKPYVDALMTAGGPDRLVWASDWPWVSFEKGRTYAGCLADLETWVADGAVRDAVLRRTPAALFGF